MPEFSGTFFGKNVKWNVHAAQMLVLRSVFWVHPSVRMSSSTTWMNVVGSHYACSSNSMPGMGFRVLRQGGLLANSLFHLPLVYSNGLRTCIPRFVWRVTYTLLTPVGFGYHWMESTNTGCNQWLSLTKIALKVPLDVRNRSLMANTSMCGEGISPLSSTCFMFNHFCVETNSIMKELESFFIVTF